MNICIRFSKEDKDFKDRFLFLERDYPNVHLVYHFNKTPLNLQDIDILISSHLSLEELNTENTLKAIIVPYTGVNQLPLDALEKRNITVVNSHAHAKFVAEKAFTLGLALLSRIVELHNQLTTGQWSGYNDSATWTSLLKKRCGILGMGEIGKHLVTLLKPFQVEVVTLKRYKEKTKNINKLTLLDSVSDVCRNSDIVFVSLPLTNDTKNIIDDEILQQMNGKYIVNVGRGNLIEEKAFYQALKNKTLKGAAIDVWYNYPKIIGEKTYPSKYPFHELKNVIVSPHCAGREETSSSYVLDELIDIIIYYIKNKQFINVVNCKNGY